MSDPHYGFHAVDWARTADVVAHEAAAVVEVPGRGKKTTTEAVVFIHTLDLDSGTITRVVEGEASSWSPDDTQLVLRDRDATNGGIYVFDFATGVREQVTPLDFWAPEWRR